MVLHSRILHPIFIFVRSAKKILKLREASFYRNVNMETSVTGATAGLVDEEADLCLRDR